MSLLDEARRINDLTANVHGRSLCLYCSDASLVCPWLSMPKIVAVLEAAEALRMELTRLRQPVAKRGDELLYALYPETITEFLEALDA